MKNFSVIFTVFLLIFLLFSSVVFGFGFDPKLAMYDPEWKRDVIKTYPDGKFLVKAVNPKIGEMPSEVLLLTEVQIDKNLEKVVYKIFFYILKMGNIKEMYVLAKSGKYIKSQIPFSFCDENDEEEDERGQSGCEPTLPTSPSAVITQS